MSKKKRPATSFARKSCVIATEIALAMMAAPLAYAQQAVQKAERIEVTGSRIPAPNLESTSPVAVISAEDIKISGVRNVEDLLNSLPQVFADYGSNQSNGATGTATVNLRNLGANRTLVLVNGRRLPAGSPLLYATDLNQIPAALIQRVEILTGGASAVYGSDAVAGVVNFIMRDNFQGVQGEVNYSFYQHNQNYTSIADVIRGRAATNAAQFNVPGDVSHDGDSTDVSLTLGSNFANDKGNATVFMSYKKDKPVLQANRDFSACAIGATATVWTCAGSSTSFPGRFILDGGAGASRTVADANGGVRPYAAATDQFNFAPYNYFQRPSERYGFSAFAHYDLNSHARAYTEFTFHDDHTDAVIAPSGDFGNDAIIHFENPLLSAAWRTTLGLTGAGTTSDILILRRNLEGGGRDNDLRHTSYRYVVGMKGDILKDWDYDLYMQTGKVILSEIYRNDFSSVRIGRALDVVSDAAGNPACRSALDGSDPACVPWNIWRLGGVTPAALAYLQTPGLQKGYTSQALQGATLSTDLGNYGIRLPGAKNGVGIAVGVERRVEKLQLETDVEFTTGDLAGQGGPTIGLGGQYTVKEYFGEARIPIIEGRPMFDILSANASYRYSDYSTGVSTDTYGLGLEWGPVKTVRMRGSYQQAVRAPNVIELFTAQGLNLFEMPSDPCGANPSASLAACQRTGITATTYGSTLLTNSAGQYNYLQGGNPTLKPEKSKSYTLGLVLTPMRNASATLDYFNIKLDEVINNIPPALILNQCLTSSQFCDLIHRDVRGSLWLPNGGFITATNLNLSKWKTSGLDLTLTYNHNMGAWGGLGFYFIGTYLQEFKQEPVPGLGEYDCKGLFGTTCGSPLPEWRHKLRATWSTPWKADVAFTWRHINKVALETTSSNPLLNAPTLDLDKELAARDYIDIAASWPLTKQLTLRGGVNNIFDKDPPVVSNTITGPRIFGNGNTFPQVYDSLGRKVFVTLTLNF